MEYKKIIVNTRLYLGYLYKLIYKSVLQFNNLFDNFHHKCKKLDHLVEEIGQKRLALTNKVPWWQSPHHTHSDPPKATGALLGYCFASILACIHRTEIAALTVMFDHDIENAEPHKSRNCTPRARIWHQVIKTLSMKFSSYKNQLFWLLA